MGNAVVDFHFPKQPISGHDRFGELCCGYDRERRVEPTKARNAIYLDDLRALKWDGSSGIAIPIVLALACSLNKDACRRTQKPRTPQQGGGLADRDHIMNPAPLQRSQFEKMAVGGGGIDYFVRVYVVAAMDFGDGSGSCLLSNSVKRDWAERVVAGRKDVRYLVCHVPSVGFHGCL
ncbi:hypothetical protein [Haematomicrobium sanguinis]|uniref:hypothetical protein n=1 Tax=Haematomicrobium sanguinis TaxID=479106 RepID=UPI0012F7523E|nr:hypothetical protein [Haematomicrobium sanguinis]